MILATYAVMYIRKRIALENIKSKQESENWKSILMILNEAVIVCNGSKIQFHNEKFQKMLKIILDSLKTGDSPNSPSHGSPIEADFFNNFSEDNSQKLLALIDNQIRKNIIKGHTGMTYSNMGLLDMCKEGLDGEYAIVQPDEDSHIKYLLNIKKVRFNDENSTLFLIRDPTDTEKLHQILIEQKYREALLSTVTHELKTPLMTISAALDILKKDIPKNLHIDAAIVAGKILKYYLHDINDIKRIAENKFIMEPQKTSIIKIMDRLKRLLQMKAELKNIRLLFDIKQPIPEYILIDKRRLLQVLLNIAYNSIKYTFDGEVKITVYIKEPGILKIEIIDTGIGIESNVQSGIFKMFGSVDRKAKARETGIGIGLYLCKQIITALNGSLNIISEIRKGTTCLIEIPYDNFVRFSLDSTAEFTVPGQPHINDSVHKMKSWVENESKTPKILVVDDDPLVTLAVKGMLTKLQCEVFTAENGQIAVNFMKNSNSIFAPNNICDIDLIIMDANMPVMNGYDAARKIQELVLEKIIKPVNIVCLSAQESVEHAELCAKSGMTYIRIFIYVNFLLVEKPCSLSRLSDLLRHYNLLKSA